MKVNCYYCNYKNFGDQLNKVLFQKEINMKTGWSKYEDAVLIGIGSIIEAVMEKPKEKRKSTERKCICFSCGFANEKQINELTDNGREGRLFRPVDFRAVRGEKTLAVLQKYHLIEAGKKPILADGGLLSCDLLEEDIEKKYDVGIVPHAAERNYRLFAELNRKIPNSVIIDIRKDPVSFIREIAQCKTIISTAMHPLIASDALRIPNLWIRLREDEAVTNRFKFDDYYSIYSTVKEPRSAYTINSNIMQEIEEQYDIPDVIVKLKQDELRQALFKIAGELKYKSDELEKEYILNWFYIHFVFTPRKYFFRIIRKIKRMTLDRLLLKENT